MSEEFAEVSAVQEGKDPGPLARYPELLQWYQQGAHARLLAWVHAQEAAGEAAHLSADVFNLAGVAARRQGLPAESERLYRQALALDPLHSGSLNNLAIVLQDLQRPAEAEACYRQAIERAPADPLPWVNLGNLYLARGVAAEAPEDRLHAWSEAEAAYAQALAARADLPEAQRGLAELAAQRGERPHAIRCLREILRARPQWQEIYLRLSALLLDENAAEEAMQVLQEGYARWPRAIPILLRLGSACQALGQKEAAAGWFRAVLAVDARHAEAWNSLGIVLHEQKQYGASEAAYRQAIAAAPEYAEAYNNLAVLLQKLKRFEAAEPLYQRALALAPDYAAARCNYGLWCLAQGRFEEGWVMYEARYAPDRTVAFPTLPRPQWQGESLQGKGILIWNEQGLGDELQFARYAAVLKSQGAAHVGLICKKPLTRLFRSLAGVDALHEEETRFSLKPYDYWTFPLSIPRYVGTTVDTIPAQPSYLAVEAARRAHWRPRLAPLGTAFKVGLVWKGRAEYTNDSNRSLPALRLLAPLWQIPGVAFVSLQKGEAEAEAACPPPGQPMLALGADFQDFADTAAVVQELDLVLCVDTGIAHLCGALGVPCWVMLPYVGTDWRWGLQGEQTAWYPSLRLFRQSSPDAWSELIDTVRQALAQTVGRAPGASPTLEARIRALNAVDRALIEELVNRLSAGSLHGG